MKLKYIEIGHYGHIIFLFCIIGIGATLRFYNLSELSLWNNEDYLAISVRSILENGIPLFPSDIIYPRALPNAYLTSLFVWAFGFSEFSLRAPGAIFSTFNIILTYVFARQLADRRVAILAAALIAVFFWEIYMAQMARMYAIFSFSILLSLIAIHAAEIDNKKHYKALAIFMLVLAAFSHQLAIALVIMLLLYIPYFSYKDKNLSKIIPYILVLLVAIVINKQISSYYYGQWHELVMHTSNALIPVQNETGFISTLINTAAPLKVHLFSILSDTEKLIYYASGMLLFVALNRFITSYIFKFALAAIIISLLFQQTLTAFILFATLYISQIWVKGRYKWQEYLLALFVLAAGAFLWLAFSLATINEAQLKMAIKSVISYPMMFFRIYLENFTWLSIVFLFSCLIIIAHIYRFKKFSGPVFLFLVFFAPLIALGFHPAALERMYERYIHFLTPFYIIIISYGVVTLLNYTATQWKNKNILSCLALSFVLIITAFLSYENVFLRSLSLVNKHYGENTRIYNSWLGRYYFHPDHKGASLMVSDNYMDGDIIIATDILAHFAYMPIVDFQLTLSEKRDAEGWIGVGSINSSQALREVLKKYADQRIWVIVSAFKAMNYRENAEFKEIINILEGKAMRSYTMRDNWTKIYCLDCD